MQITAAHTNGAFVTEHENFSFAPGLGLEECLAA